MTGGLVGVLLAKYNFRLPWLIAGIGTIVCAVFSFKLLKEEYFQRNKFSWQESCRGVKKIFVTSIKVGYRNKSIWTLIVLATLLTVAFQPLNMNWQPYFKDNLGLEVVGLAWVGITLFQLFGSVLAGWLMKKTSEAVVINWGILLISIFVLIMALVPNAWLVFSLFCLHEVGRGIFNPVSKTYLHDRIDSQNRATISSFQSMIMKLGAGFGWLMSGILSDQISVQKTWLIAGVIIFIVYVFSFKLKKI